MTQATQGYWDSGSASLFCFALLYLLFMVEMATMVPSIRSSHKIQSRKESIGISPVHFLSLFIKAEWWGIFQETQTNFSFISLAEVDHHMVISLPVTGRGE